MRRPEDALRDEERLLPHELGAGDHRLELLLRVDLDGVEDGVVVEAALGVAAVPERANSNFCRHFCARKFKFGGLDCLYLPLCRICSAFRQKNSVEPTSCMSSRKVLPMSSKASAILSKIIQLEAP